MKSMTIWLISVLKLALTIQVRETGDKLNRVIVVKTSHNLQLIQPFWPPARHYKKKVKGSEISTSWKLPNLEDAHFTVRNMLKLTPLFFNCQWIAKKKIIVSSDVNERKYLAKIYVIVFFYTVIISGPIYWLSYQSRKIMPLLLLEICLAMPQLQNDRIFYTFFKWYAAVKSRWHVCCLDLFVCS